jgi:hypothetical protein
MLKSITVSLHLANIHSLRLWYAGLRRLLRILSHKALQFAVQALQFANLMLKGVACRLPLLLLRRIWGRRALHL